MGFFKRFFSLNSHRKNKKKTQPRDQHVDGEGRLLTAQEAQHEQEAQANRLLRSSSAHFAVVAEVDYASLPPLPHPINAVTPATTPLRATSNVQRQGTYVVKVHGRTLHSRTEFPNANPPIPHDEPSTPVFHTDSEDDKRKKHRDALFTPRDQSRLLGLRQDPSVASLLNMYDSHGCLDSKIFSNTPPAPAPIQSQSQEFEVEPEGRAQTKRSGSTLRQLLGNPDSKAARNSSALEGDISWAERFLVEHLDGSTHTLESVSSSVLQTPLDAPLVDVSKSMFAATDIMDATFSSLGNETSNCPAISSMEVELSIESDEVHVPYEKYTSDTPEPQTPQRASEVFGFLTERRKSLLIRKSTETERALPALPLPSPDSFLDATPNTDMTAAQTPDTADTSATSMVSSNPTSCSDVHNAQVHTAQITKLTSSTPALLKQLNRMPSTPQAVSRTGTGGSDNVERAKTTASRIPRGPRSRPASRRTQTYASIADLAATNVRPPSLCGSQSSRSGRSRKIQDANEDKENSQDMDTRDASEPSTPVRARSIFEMRYPSYVNGAPPSPASSSELSPVARDMMISLRDRRARARETGRRAWHQV